MTKGWCCFYFLFCSASFSGCLCCMTRYQPKRHLHITVNGEVINLYIQYFCVVIFNLRLCLLSGSHSHYGCIQRLVTASFTAVCTALNPCLRSLQYPNVLFSVCLRKDLHHKEVLESFVLRWQVNVLFSQISTLAKIMPQKQYILS